MSRLRSYYSLLGGSISDEPLIHSWGPDTEYRIAERTLSTDLYIHAQVEELVAFSTQIFVTTSSGGVRGYRSMITSYLPSPKDYYGIETQYLNITGDITTYDDDVYFMIKNNATREVLGYKYFLISEVWLGATMFDQDKTVMDIIPSNKIYDIQYADLPADVKTLFDSIA